MNMLTTRKLPMWQTPAKDNAKFRLDRNLVRLIHDAVQIKNPKLRVGKRFALELALTQWLHSEGLLREGVSIPELLGESSGDYE